MMHLLKPRVIYLLIFATSVILVATAIYIEPFASMNPCPMCVMQRFAFGAVALFALLAAMHNPVNVMRRVYALLVGLSSLIGASIAARQVWLQHLPADQVPACGPGLDYMLEVFPILEVIEMAVRGTGDCAEVQWTFLGLSIPGWSLIVFSGMAIASIYILFTKQNDNVGS